MTCKLLQHSINLIQPSETEASILKSEENQNSRTDLRDDNFRNEQLHVNYLKQWNVQLETSNEKTRDSTTLVDLTTGGNQYYSESGVCVRTDLNATQSIQVSQSHVQSELKKIEEIQHQMIGQHSKTQTDNINRKIDNQSRSPMNLSLIQPGTILDNSPSTSVVYCEQVFKCIGYNDVNNLKALLENGLDQIDVIEMRDARKFTVLSFACYKNNEECFMILYNHALDFNLKSYKFEQKRKILSEWANTPTDEEFTALHFATYHGNYSLIRFLIDNANADIHKRNKFGSTVLHIAAQGDQALPLIYFHRKGMDINIRDNRQSTPLHWACYSKSEIALNYLLSMIPQGLDLNPKDQKGFTPLHLAVKSVEALKSTRPVRALLLKGADRNSVDNEGKTATQMISDSLPENIKLDLVEMLKKPSYWECLMIKTPLLPLKPNYKTHNTFWAIIIVTQLTFWFILFPTSQQDPGRLKPALRKQDGHPLDFLELLQKFSPTDLCPDCQVIRTPRSRHCAICNQCVERFDHHCPWINNCVGIKNHNYFIMFLFFTMLFVILALFVTIKSIVQGILEDSKKNMLHPLCIFDLCENPIVYEAVAIFDLLVSGLFVFPVGLLLIVHLKNYASGKTTNERFSRKAASSFTDGGDGSDYDTSEQEESLIGDERTSRPSVIDDITAERGTTVRKSKIKPRKSGSVHRKRGCLRNWKLMMCNKRIPRQLDLYERQCQRLQNKQNSYKEVTQCDI